jgi:ATP-binding cassette subfamily C protein
MNKNRRSGIVIMAKLVGLVKPLLHIMLLAIILGAAGYLCAISLTILGVKAMVEGSGKLFALMMIFAVMRGVLHYIEQYCNHFIAFKLLAIIRNKVFSALRRLCPAKLEGRDKGNLISVITTDIELLEVFYAHTISPIVIAFITSLIMTIFIGYHNIYAGILALAGYITVGVIIPVINGKRGGNTGLLYRNQFGDLNSYILDCLRGLDETIQYNQGDNREEKLVNESDKLGGYQKKLNGFEGTQRAITNIAILAFSFGMVLLTAYLWKEKQIEFEQMIICIVSMMGSFGPVVALSNLSNNLNQTLASGERVLALLEEEPVVYEIERSSEAACDNISNENAIDSIEVKNISFAYESRKIFDNFSVDFKAGKINGIWGESGCGKSTLLKLLMRFWNVENGTIVINGEDINKIPTCDLRKLESYMTQQTYLFNDTIGNNIAIAKEDATKDEIIEAAKKASIHDFIISLPNGYDNNVGELGDSLSGGEKQRIGLARVFLHDAPLILLDEPTSNLDSLNEGIILKSLREQQGEKTVILVSHRKSTMNVVDNIIQL